MVSTPECDVKTKSLKARTALGPNKRSNELEPTTPTHGDGTMTPANENRIWRGLFLAALMGCGVAAASGERVDKPIQGWSNGKTGRTYLLMESGWVREISTDQNAKFGIPGADKFRIIHFTEAN